ncbi:MAG TPA: hypothetical protein PLD20_33650 [Blastocatellia bacterium]|nr:hypothetical protein [Blastocatellia bacterium]HMV81840.1 hypothetical protein [Blastocatellia bacterium]HMX23979.1 hypothetical protein [Blastocatellia bacterium]HMY75215.1 hypothetical protein [Blastocatellia bacterium]HMZ22919.1 hypothetical protein [Blastocatellia bacterium]
MPFVIVDTDILIDVGHGTSDAIECLARLKQHSTVVISDVTQMELIVGCRNKAELRRTEKSLQIFPKTQN